jgi:hypothetical protein
MKKKFIVATAAMLFLMPAAWAGAYVGASLGQSEMGASDGVTSADGSDSGWKVVGGYTFMKYVAVEGSYRDLGGIDEVSGTTTYQGDATSLDVFAVGMLPLSKLGLFAKAGYAHLSMDANIDDPLFTAPIVSSTSENELAYGIGMSFGVGPAEIRIEYEIFDTPETLDMFSAGAIFKF